MWGGGEESVSWGKPRHATYFKGTSVPERLGPSTCAHTVWEQSSFARWSN